MLAAVGTVSRRYRGEPAHGGRPTPVDWDGIVAEYSHCLGQSWEYIEEHLTMDQLLAYRKYFTRHPPTHFLVAGFMKYQPPADKSVPYEPPAFAQLPEVEE